MRLLSKKELEFKDLKNSLLQKYEKVCLVGCGRLTVRLTMISTKAMNRGKIILETLPAKAKGNRANGPKWRKPVEFLRPYRTGQKLFDCKEKLFFKTRKEGPKVDSEIIRIPTPTTGPEYRGVGASLPLPQFLLSCFSLLKWRCLSYCLSHHCVLEAHG
jgi:hypothetical protein